METVSTNKHPRDLDQSERLDPAPGPTDFAQDKVEQYVSGLTTSALDELRKFRDETDELMIALTKRHKMLVSAIDEHAVRVAQVIASKEIMAEQTQKMKEMFAPVQAVMTQERFNG